MSLEASKSEAHSPGEPKDLLQNKTTYNQRDKSPQKKH